MSDEAIITAVKNGDKEAFGNLAQKYGGALYSYIFYSVKDDGAAGDIYQDTLLKALSHINKYKEQGKFKQWLFAIARSKVMDHFRQNSRAVQLGDEDTADNYPGADDTASAAATNLTMSEIQNFIALLPREQQEVILLRTHMSFKEISALLGCPIGTVLARMSRGIKKLQQFIGDSYAA